MRFKLKKIALKLAFSPLWLMVAIVFWIAAILRKLYKLPPDKTDVWEYWRLQMTTNNTFNNQNREENNTFYKTNVANNIVQANSQDLTEKWKRGELKEGWYYIRNKAHSIKFNQMAFYMVYGEVSYWTNCKNEDVDEVLAPVPSFEEWKAAYECQLMESELVLTLKELLEECRDLIEWYKADCGYKDMPTESVLARIDKVLK